MFIFDSLVYPKTSKELSVTENFNMIWHNTGVDFEI